MAPPQGVTHVASKPNPRNANGHRRRELRKRVLAEETHCGLCGGGVDKTLTMMRGQHGPRCSNRECAGCVPHPMRAEVDEIVPVSLGGNPLDRSNVRLAHRECNRRRGNGMGERATAAAERPQVVASGIW